MHEVFKQENVTLEQKQFLTEANILLLNRRPDGSYPKEVLEATRFNLKTKVKEDGFMNAVSHSFQPVGEYTTPEGETRRTLIQKGLGKTAMQIAESGFEYHWSEPAFKHVRYHVKEARRDESELKPDKWHVMIEPKFSTSDADEDVAKSEHMAGTDALRTSYAATDKYGNITGRHMTAILVSDVPITAWVAMLQDENNLWGKAFDIQDPDSSLGPMGLFDQLDLSLELLPEGPINLVEAVTPYITDEQARLSVGEQILGLRQDQQKLDDEADYTAGEWLEFVKVMADSLATGRMHKDIKIFAMQLQNDWDADTLELLKRHEGDYGGYSMSVELAAILEEEWERINVGKAAIVVGDKRALKNVSKEKADQMRNDILFLRTLQQGSLIGAAEYAAITTKINRTIARADIKVGGGGCGPELKSRLGKKRDSNNPDSIYHDLDSQSLNEGGAQEQNEISADDSDNEGVGKIHYDRCRTGICPSKSKIVKVGGCRICLDHCQPEYDKGNDPLDVFSYTPQPEIVGAGRTNGLLGLFGIQHAQISKQERKNSGVLA